MSVDGETSRVMKGVQHGACDYLLKPIRMKELRNIWQHVLRKRMHEARDIGNHEMDLFDQLWMFNGTDSGNKRKDFDDKEISVHSSSMKKPRVVWTVDLHQKFVKAVNQIGFHKAGPKKILDLMAVPWLTRENVASHLQKYRLYLTRLQKGGMKHPNVSSKENSLQNPVDVCADVTNDKCSKAIAQNCKSNIYESKVKGVVSIPVAEPGSVVGDNFDSHTAGSKTSLSGLINTDVKSVDVPTPYCFTGEAPQPQYKQDFKPRFPSENQPLPGIPHQIQVDCTQPTCSLNLVPSHEMREWDRLSGKENKLSSFFKSTSGVGKLSALEAIQPVSHQINFHSLEQIPSTWSMTSQNVDQNLVNGLQSSTGNVTLGSGSVVASLAEDMCDTSIQGECFPAYNGLRNIQQFHYNEPQPISGVSTCLYDTLRFDYEYPNDSLEGIVLDQGLFIV